MNLDSVSEARLGLINPKLADLVRNMGEMLAQDNIKFRVVQGLRTWQEQAALYAQGRTALGKKVTNARAGESWHNFGLAVDLCPGVPGAPLYTPDWNPSHPSWGRMIAVGVSLGLRSGKSWHDMPHFQLTGRFGDSPNGEVRQIYQAAGMEGVWKEAQIA